MTFLFKKVEGYGRVTPNIFICVNLIDFFVYDIHHIKFKEKGPNIISQTSIDCMPCSIGFYMLTTFAKGQATRGPK